jgi:tetratricopeptide (TPR) repeat protein
MKIKTVSRKDKFKIILSVFVAMLFLQISPECYGEISQLDQAPWQEIWTLNEVKTAKETPPEKLEQPNNALELLSPALQTANTIPDTRTKAWVLINIAEKFTQLGQTDKALEVLSYALKTANAIPDTRTKEQALIDIAGKFAQTGQYDDAFAIANTLSLRNAKVKVLRNIDEALLISAVKSAQAGQLKDTLRIANSINGSEHKAKALKILCESLQADEDLEFLSQALNTAQAIPDAGWQAQALSDISVKFAQAGQYENAIRIASKISYNPTKVNALQNIDVALLGRAEAFVKAGQTDKAFEIFANGFQTATTIKDTRTRTEALRGIAQSFVKMLQMSINLSTQKKPTEPLDVKVKTSEPLDIKVKVFEPLEEDKLYGIYARGDCHSPTYILYFLKDIQLFISKDYAEMQHSISVRKTVSSLIHEQKVKEGIYEIMYFQLGKSVLKLFAAGRFDTEQDLDNFPDNPPQGILPVEFNRCNDIPSELSFIHAEGITFMNSLDDVLVKCQKEKDKCLEYIFSLVDISKDNRISKAELSRIFRIITYIAVVSGKEGKAKSEDITSISAIVSIISPSVAGAIIAGSDYDNDGQLCLEEMFFDRNISGATHVLEKFSFDVAVSFIIKAFGALSSIVKLVP